MTPPVGNCRVVRATSPGRGAVATLLVAGDDAANVVNRIVRTSSGKPLPEIAVGRVVLARCLVEPDVAGEANQLGEELVVSRRDDRHVELHCHGGRAAIDSVLSALTAAGCPSQTPEAWLAEEMPPLSAAATLALSEATTLRTAAILLDQQAGAMRDALQQIFLAMGGKTIESGCHALGVRDVGMLNRSTTHNHGHVEDSEAMAPRTSDLGLAKQLLQELLNFAPLGLHLIKPWRVALAGAPNVGKSSLANAILGYERAIVHATPGTTRDAVTATTAIDGWPVELIDTAGVRESHDAIEAAGVRLAREQHAAADLVLLVCDGSQPWSADAIGLIAKHPHAILVHNKFDIADPSPRPAGLYVSASTGSGLAELLAEIARRLVPLVPPPGAAVPFSPPLVADLQAALAALSQHDLPAAIASLDKWQDFPLS